MNKWIRRLAAGLLVMPLTALAPAALADSTPEAQKWLKGIVEVYDKAPLTADLEMEIGAVPGGPPMSGKIQGTLTLKDRTHQRVEMTMEMGGGGGGGMTMGLVSVTDGTHVWNEMSSPMGKQVIKLSLEDIDEMAQSQGLAPGMGSMDPVAQMEQLSKMMNLDVKSIEGGKVTLEGTMTEEAKASMGAQQVPMDKMTLIIDEETGFPSEMKIGGDQPAITMKFQNVKFLKESELPAGTFDYTPPEGVQVMDGAQLKAMMDARQGGGGR